MENKATTEQLATVTNLQERRGVETIDGIRLALGSMSHFELTVLERQCAVRVQDAIDDHMIVADYLQRAIERDGGDSA